MFAKKNALRLVQWDGRRRSSRHEEPWLRRLGQPAVLVRLGAAWLLLDDKLKLRSSYGTGFDTPSFLEPENQLIVSRETMAWFWDHYAPDSAVRTHPDASPLRAPSLAGLPPTVILSLVGYPEGHAQAFRARADESLIAAGLAQIGISPELGERLREHLGIVGG